MERTCTDHACSEPEEVGCNRGDLLQDCPYWQKAHQGSGEATLSADSSSDSSDPHSPSSGDRLLRLPWTGNSLGLRDLMLVTASSSSDVVGLVGPYNAGKTTLLTLIYLVLQNGEGPNSPGFAGSLTLRGWDNLAANLRWGRGTEGPRFPPHTSRGAGRRPGLLHLAFRDTSLSRRNLLLTDPPGEWFSLWAQKENAEGAEGARWVQRYADKFVFLVDREALASPERGKTREALKDLARRLAAGLSGRKVAVVWTKSDIQILPAIESDLRNCFSTSFPHAAEFKVQMRFGDEDRTLVEVPCLNLLSWLLAPASNAAVVDDYSPPVLDRTDLFLSLR